MVPPLLRRNAAFLFWHTILDDYIVPQPVRNCLVETGAIFFQFTFLPMPRLARTKFFPLLEAH